MACLVLVAAAVLCATRSVAADPAERVARQSATAQQGSAVIFFASYEGQLRDLPFSPIAFNRVVVNQGSAYDSGTGVFTAPVAGIYQFVFTAQLCRGNHNNVWYFLVNGQTKMSCLGQVSGGDTARHTCYFMEQLKNGDEVSVRQKEGGCAWASTVSRTINFSGVLLASEGVSRLGDKYRSCPLIGPGKSLTSGSAGWGVAASSAAVPLLLCWFFFH